MTDAREEQFWEQQKQLAAQPLPDPVKRTRHVRLWLVAIGAVALAGIVFGVAKAAERITPGPHEIVLIAFGKDYDQASRTIITLSGTYDDRAQCEQAKVRLVVKVTGAKVVCYPVESGRVN